MAFYYLETSALVKLYVRESGTERVLALANRTTENRLAILALTQVEFRSAVRRRERNGEIPPLVAIQLLKAFKRHVEQRFVSQVINDFVLDIASALVDRHALRAYDAIQFVRNTAEAGRLYELAFIDDSHRYEHVYDTCVDLHRILVPRAFALFHDYNDPRNAHPDAADYGVYQAVHAGLSKDYFEFWGIYGCCGLFRRK